jgi:hypothetical protein
MTEIMSVNKKKCLIFVLMLKKLTNHRTLHTAYTTYFTAYRDNRLCLMGMYTEMEGWEKMVKHLCPMSMYRANVAAIGNSCFCLVNF